MLVCLDKFEWPENFSTVRSNIFFCVFLNTWTHIAATTTNEWTKKIGKRTCTLIKQKPRRAQQLTEVWSHCERLIDCPVAAFNPESIYDLVKNVAACTYFKKALKYMVSTNVLANHLMTTRCHAPDDVKEKLKGEKTKRKRKRQAIVSCFKGFSADFLLRVQNLIDH